VAHVFKVILPNENNDLGGGQIAPLNCVTMRRHSSMASGIVESARCPVSTTFKEVQKRERVEGLGKNLIFTEVRDNVINRQQRRERGLPGRLSFRGATRSNRRGEGRLRGGKTGGELYEHLKSEHLGKGSWRVGGFCQGKRAPFEEIESFIMRENGTKEQGAMGRKFELKTIDKVCAVGVLGYRLGKRTRPKVEKKATSQAEEWRQGGLTAGEGENKELKEGARHQNDGPSKVYRA